MDDALPTSLPVPNADTAPFWAGCGQGELRVQRCRTCGHAQFPPRAFCARCQASAPSWEAASRRGRVVSHTRVHRAPSPAFKAEIPYVVALVDLEEGPRMMVRLHGEAAAASEIGTQVEIRFEAPAGPHGIAMPYAVLASSGS